MLNVARVILLMVVLLVSVPLSTYAAVNTGAGAEGSNAGDDHLVSYRHAEATNPRCGTSDELAVIGGAGIGAAMAAGLTGVIVFNTHLPGARIVGTLLMVGSITTIAAGVAASAPYFACNWSFVRHPVLRFERGEQNYTPDTNNHKEKNYKQCKDPKGGTTDIVTKYKGQDCNKEFVNMAEYYACIAPNTSLEEASKNEPICPERQFEKAQDYAWPKNRVSSSRYIEVCYRHPLNTLVTAPFALFAMQFTGKSYTELLKNGKYPRESTFGDAEMHKAKLAVSGAWGISNNPVDCIVLEAGQEGTIYDVTYRAVERGSRLCVDAVKLSGVRMMGQPEIGCQLRPNTAPVPMCAQSIARETTTKEGVKTITSYDNSKCYSCYVAETCKGVANLHSRSVFPVTAVIVGCIVDSLKNLLEPPASCASRVQSVSVNPGFLKVAQEKLKKSVMAALILALILFSIKAVLGGVQNASELYMTAIKFAMVIYFTQGSAMSYAYDQLTKLSIGLSDIVLQAAGGKNGVCDFTAADYEPKYVYLMPWDRLDCRVMFYLGSQLTAGTGTGVVLTLLLSAGLLIAAILINAKVIICLVAFFAVLMLVFTVIWTVYVFLLSLIALTVLTIISPLMIPMCLFQATKGFFDGWTRQLMTYALYPVILFAFMSLMFTVFDNLYFGDLKFKRGGSSTPATSGAAKEKIWFELQDKKACEDPKNESNLACMFDSVRFHTKPLFLGISVSSPEFRATTAQIWTKLGVFVLIGFLFYHFLSSISYIAGELAGDPRAGAIGAGGMNPRSMARGAAGMASAMRSFASGKAADLGDRLRSGMGGSGKDADGTDKASGGSAREKGAKDSDGGGAG